MPGACGVPPFSALTPPYTIPAAPSPLLSNPGAVNAFITIDSMDFFGNGLFDDNTTASGFGISFDTCGGTAPKVSLVSRNRITITVPFCTTLLDLTIGVFSTWTGQIYFRNGVLVPAPPTSVGACVLGDFPAQSTTQAGCTVNLLP